MMQLYTVISIILLDYVFFLFFIKVSEKTGEARNRRPTYKEKTNSIYVQWKPEDSTSFVMSQFFDPAQDCQDGPPKQSMVSACHYSTT